jgi:hypothetical protein
MRVVTPEVHERTASPGMRSRSPVTSLRQIREKWSKKLLACAAVAFRGDPIHQVVRDPIDDFFETNSADRLGRGFDPPPDLTSLTKRAQRATREALYRSKTA